MKCAEFNPGGFAGFIAQQARSTRDSATNKADAGNGSSERGA